MHPAKSVILFTSFSGAGYGLFAMTLMLQLIGVVPANGNITLTAIVVAFIMVTIGLLSSVFHLGTPKNAWRSFSQWKSSWLSREGVLAIITYLPMVVLAYFALDSMYGNVWENLLGDARATFNNMEGRMFVEPYVQWIAWFGVVTAFVTVYATSMIYRSLKPIDAWHNGYVSPIYLLFAVVSGLVILNVIAGEHESGGGMLGLIAQVFLALTLIAKWKYWKAMRTMSLTSTLESATGLGHMGKVTSLERPHTEDNYLLKEMGYQVARKHADKLKILFYIYVIFAMVMLQTGLLMETQNFWINAFAAISLMKGVFVERWLFFAEARHTVALYYGK
jgi:DMSO reductase anchor subunit